MNARALTLVFLPGLHGTDSLFEEAMATDWGGLGRTVVTLPSDGPQDYSSLVEHLMPVLPARDLVLVAESFSTPLAARLAECLPGRVRALVLIGGFCSPPRLSILRLLPIGWAFVVAPPRFLLQWLMAEPASPQLLLARLSSAAAGIRQKTLVARIRSTLSLCEQEIPNLPEVPVLLLQAAHDRVIPRRVRRRLEHHFPHAEVREIDGPHLLIQTRTAICRESCLDFVRRLEPGAFTLSKSNSSSP